MHAGAGSMWRWLGQIDGVVASVEDPGHTGGEYCSLLAVQPITKRKQLYYTSNIVYVFSMALSKAAVASLILRLTTIPMQRKFVWGLIGFNTIWAIGLLFSNALQCNPAVPWLIVNQKKQCADFV